MGEGQTDTPINLLNQGEVLTPPIEKTVFTVTATNISVPHPPDDEPSGYSYEIGKAD